LNTVSWLFGFLNDVRSEFTDDVSELTVGTVKVGHTELRNVVSKLTLQIAQKPKNQETLQEEFNCLTLKVKVLLLAGS
jgi:hypothetical protein